MRGKISFVRNKGALIGCDPQVYLHGIPTISFFLDTFLVWFTSISYVIHNMIDYGEGPF